MRKFDFFPHQKKEGGSPKKKGGVKRGGVLFFGEDRMLFQQNEIFRKWVNFIENCSFNAKCRQNAGFLRINLNDEVCR